MAISECEVDRSRGLPQSLRQVTVRGGSLLTSVTAITWGRSCKAVSLIGTSGFGGEGRGGEERMDVGRCGCGGASGSFRRKVNLGLTSIPGLATRQGLGRLAFRSPENNFIFSITTKRKTVHPSINSTCCRESRVTALCPVANTRGPSFVDLFFI
jgi:hypothetical protein